MNETTTGRAAQWVSAATALGHWRSGTKAPQIGAACRVQWFDGWRYGVIQNVIPGGAFVRLESGSVLLVEDPCALWTMGVTEIPGAVMGGGDVAAPGQ